MSIYTSPTYIYRMKKNTTESNGVSEQIKRVRKKKGITQVELAEKLATTQRAISYYENPKTNLSMEMLHRIAEALEVPVKKLLDENKSQYEERYVTPALQKKLNRVADLPQADQQFVAKTIDMLIHKNGMM